MGLEFPIENTIQNLVNKVRTTRMLKGVHNSSSAGKFTLQISCMPCTGNGDKKTDYMVKWVILLCVLAVQHPSSTQILAILMTSDSVSSNRP